MIKTRKTNKFFALLLAFVMVLGMIPAMATVAKAEEISEKIPALTEISEESPEIEGLDELTVNAEEEILIPEEAAEIPEEEIETPENEVSPFTEEGERISEQEPDEESQREIKPYDEGGSEGSLTMPDDGTYYAMIAFSTNVGDDNEKWHWCFNFNERIDGKNNMFFSQSSGFFANNVKLVVENGKATLRLTVPQTVTKLTSAADPDTNLITEDSYSIHWGSKWEARDTTTEYRYADIPLDDLNTPFEFKITNKDGVTFSKSAWVRVDSYYNEPQLPEALLDIKYFGQQNRFGEYNGKYYQGYSSTGYYNIVPGINVEESIPGNLRYYYSNNLAVYMVYDVNGDTPEITEDISVANYFYAGIQRNLYFNSQWYQIAHPEGESFQNHPIDFLHDDLTVNVRAKLILKGDGYQIESDEKVLKTLEFWPCGIEQSSFTDGDVTLNFGSNDRGYPVPDGSVFKAEPVDDAGKTRIAQILKEKFDLDVPNEAFYAYKEGLYDANGNAATPIGYESGNAGWKTYEFTPKTFEFQVELQEGFSPTALRLFWISPDGETAQEVIEQRNLFAEMFQKNYLTLDMMHDLNGTIVFVQDAPMNAEVAEGTYELPVKMLDKNNKPVSGSPLEDKAIVFVAADGSRTAYIPIKEVGGKYAESFTYGSGKTAAEIKDEYTIDGKTYPKVIVVPFPADSTVVPGTMSLDGQDSEFNYAISVMNAPSLKSDAVIGTTAPQLRTSTGKEMFENSDTAVVNVTSYAANAKVYYTLGEGDFDANTWTELKKSTLTFRAPNEERASYKIRAVAVTEKYGVSPEAEFSIAFAAEGEAVEPAAAPSISCVPEYYSRPADEWFALAKVIILELKSETEGAEIYYTLDGSEPSKDNPNAVKYDPANPVFAYFFSNQGVDNGAESGTIKAIAYKDGMLSSDVASRTFTRNFDWWERVEDGEYDVNLRLLHFTEENTLSMGHLTLTGKGKLTVKGDDRSVSVQFQPMNLGGIPAFLRNMWYFDSVEDAQSRDFRNKWHEGTYVMGLLEGTEVEWATIKVFNKDMLQPVAIQSNFDPMGIQRAWLEIDYSAISGEEKETEVTAPVISYTMNDDNTGAEVTFSLPEEATYPNADIYYMISNTAESWDEEQKTKYNAGEKITVDVEQANPENQTLNVLAMAVDAESGKKSVVTVQKLSFEEKDPVPVTIEDGTYSVPVEMRQFADPDSYSMGNQALDGPARVVVKNGKAEYTLTFKGITMYEQFGHLLKLWTYPGDDITAERSEATITSTFEDTNMYGEKDTFLRTVAFDRTKAGEEKIYIRVRADAMESDGIYFDQNAILSVDWSKATPIQNPPLENGDYTLSATAITESTYGTDDEKTFDLTRQFDPKIKLTKTDDGMKLSLLYKPSNIDMQKVAIDDAEGTKTEFGKDENGTAYEFTMDIADIKADHKLSFTYNTGNPNIGNGGVMTHSVYLRDYATSVWEGYDWKPADTSLPDGEYILHADMINANKRQKSMSDNAINHDVKLIVSTVDGQKQYKIQVEFKGLTIGSQLGYLKSLSYYDEGYTNPSTAIIEGNLKPAKVLSEYDVVDMYNEAEGYKYPKLLEFPLVSTALNDPEGYVALHVFVPIMDAISAGSGDQDVWMKLDWSSIKEFEEEILAGDINGDGTINNKDITRLMRYVKYKDVDVNESVLDVNGDGIVNNKDITRLMRYVKYKDVEIFPK